MKKSTFLLVGVLLGACSDEVAQRSQVDHPPVDVTVSEVKAASSAETHVGALEPDFVASVSTRISGVVEAVLVHEGQAVRAGEPLVRLDASSIEAGVDAAQAQVELAERSFDRVEALARDGAASQQELDEVSARLQVARAQLSGALAQRTYVVLSAPFDGVIKARHADPGMLALPGQSLLVVQSREASTVRLELPGELWEHSAVGRTMRVSDAKSGWATEARVTRRAPGIGDASRRFRVELSVASVEGGPLPGTLVDVIMDGTGGETLWVPADAVFERGQLSGVFAVIADTLRLRWIRTGVRDGDRVEMLAGLPVGDLVVRAPASDLRDGVPVGTVSVAAWDPSRVSATEEGSQP